MHKTLHNCLDLMTTVDLHVLVIVLAEYTVLQIGSATCPEFTVHFSTNLYTIWVGRSARVSVRPRARPAASVGPVGRVGRHQYPQRAGTELRRRIHTMNSVCGNTRRTSC